METDILEQKLKEKYEQEYKQVIEARNKVLREKDEALQKKDEALQEKDKSFIK